MTDEEMENILRQVIASDSVTEKRRYQANSMMFLASHYGWTVKSRKAGLLLAQNWLDGTVSREADVSKHHIARRPLPRWKRQLAGHVGHQRTRAK